MIGRATWWRCVAGLLAALLIAMLGPAPATALPLCPDEAGVAAQAIDAGSSAATSDTPADDVCPDGCLACAHCQSHHAAAGLPTTPASTGARFAKHEHLGQTLVVRLQYQLAYGLKRPPRV